MEKLLLSYSCLSSKLESPLQPLTGKTKPLAIMYEAVSHGRLLLEIIQEITLVSNDESFRRSCLDSIMLHVDKRLAEIINGKLSVTAWLEIPSLIVFCTGLENLLDFDRTLFRHEVWIGQLPSELSLIKGLVARPMAEHVPEFRA